MCTFGERILHLAVERDALLGGEGDRRDQRGGDCADQILCMGV
jgi:hypothetical protein